MFAGPTNRLAPCGGSGRVTPHRGYIREARALRTYTGLLVGGTASHQRVRSLGRSPVNRQCAHSTLRERHERNTTFAPPVLVLTGQATARVSRSAGKEPLAAGRWDVAADAGARFGWGLVKDAARVAAVSALISPSRDGCPRCNAPARPAQDREPHGPTPRSNLSSKPASDARRSHFYRHL